MTVKEITKPPFPESMTFREILTNLFNTDFLTPEELTMLCDAGEMYANGVLKQASLQSTPIPIPIPTPCVELEKEVERLKGLITRIIPLAESLCTKCLSGNQDLTPYDEIKQFKTENNL